jgi:hypothetical protein
MVTARERRLLNFSCSRKVADRNVQRSEAAAAICGGRRERQLGFSRNSASNDAGEWCYSCGRRGLVRDSRFIVDSPPLACFHWAVCPSSFGRIAILGKVVQVDTKVFCDGH